jgi:DNA repair exonuclease SbcCD ATPase subunit
MKSTRGRMVQKEEEEKKKEEEKKEVPQDDYDNLFNTYFVQPIYAKPTKVSMKSPRPFNQNLLEEKRANLEKKREKLVQKRMKFARKIEKIREGYPVDEVRHEETSRTFERVICYRKALKKYQEALENTEVVYEIEPPKLVLDAVTHSYVEEVPLRRLLGITSDRVLMKILMDDAIPRYTLHQDGYYTIVFCNTSNDIISYIIIKENCLI